MSVNFSKHQPKGIRRLIHATGYSLNGFQTAWKHEAAFRQETVLACALLLMVPFFPISHLEKLALVFSLVLVVIMELINSAIEAVVDRVGTDIHELSKRAKDMASAAVFLSLCLALFTWLLVLFF